METIVTQGANKVVIGPGRPTVLIGERINPTGEKKLADALRANNLEFLKSEAIEQADAGADILDVNVSTFGVDDEKLLPLAVQTVMETVDLPLCIDSPNPEALRAALEVYKGKALINSVTGEARSLQKVLPLVKEHAAAVIALLQDDEGIPTDADKRLSIAHQIVNSAVSLGIPQEDIVIDCLVMAVGADVKSGQVVLETIKRVKSELGVNMTMGLSNISFGLPGREIINNTFVAMAISAGVACHIVNVSKIRPAVLSADLILGKDNFARRYLGNFRNK